jgi:hypothetical protein
MNEDLLIKTVVELKQDMIEVKERLNEVDGLKKNIEIIMNSQDKLIGMLERLDTERLVTHHDLTSLERRVTVVEKEVKKIKPVVAVA